MMAFRLLKKEDLTEIEALEREIFPDPWSLSSLEELLAPPYLGLCLLTEGEIAGYALGSVIAREAELFRIAVSPARRRQGLGKDLLSAFLSSLSKKGAASVFLEVREGNLPAQALYRASGFVPVGKRRGYYRDPREDAVLYQYTFQK